MKRVARKKERRVVALALTWDGARWPIKALSTKARAFLTDSTQKPALATREALARLFVRKDIDEIRICWIPRLKGGNDVLAAPFPAPGNVRIRFRAVRQIPLGECLGIVYLYGK